MGTETGEGQFTFERLHRMSSVYMSVPVGGLNYSNYREWEQEKNGFVLFEVGSLYVALGVSWSSLCRPDRPPTQKDPPASAY